jgi:hypothetical protein
MCVHIFTTYTIYTCIQGLSERGRGQRGQFALGPQFKAQKFAKLEK